MTQIAGSLNSSSQCEWQCPVLCEQADTTWVWSRDSNGHHLFFVPSPLPHLPLPLPLLSPFISLSLSLSHSLFLFLPYVCMCIDVGGNEFVLLCVQVCVHTFVHVHVVVEARG